MKFIRLLAVLSLYSFFGSVAWAADQDEHKAHHPDAVSSSGKVTKADTKRVSSNESMNHEAMEKMDSQMKVMREIHEKMMKAKTPEERKALMAEHMKAMQGGMSMMGDMSKRGDMSMMAGMSKDKMGDMKDGMKCDMDSELKAHHKMMEKRMEMMETMMQMMMDRASVPDAYGV